MYRNKYWSEITTQPKIIYLDEIIDPAFRFINRLIVLSFKADDDPTRDCFDKYYMQTVGIKGFKY